MKASNILTSNWRNVSAQQWGPRFQALPIALLSLLGGVGAIAAAPVSASPVASTPAGVIPVPALPAGSGQYAQVPNGYANLPPAGAVGQQYVVLIEGGNPALLDQVRAVEPGAFQTTYDGRSVIQAGRYSYYQNAQQQQQALSTLGVGAEIASVAPRSPSYSELPAAPVTTYTSPDQLPPLPVVAVPQGSAPASIAPIPAAAQSLPPAQNVEFGQVPSFPASSGGAVSSPPPSSAPTLAAVPTPAAPVNAPYYVVIPTSRNDLPTVSSRVVQLGAPADRVLQRTSPLGPNVAVGPFSDRGLAEQWSNFFRDAGYSSSRVHYEP